VVQDLILQKCVPLKTRQISMETQAFAAHSDMCPSRTIGRIHRHWVPRERIHRCRERSRAVPRRFLGFRIRPPNLGYWTMRGPTPMHRFPRSHARH